MNCFMTLLNYPIASLIYSMSSLVCSMVLIQSRNEGANLISEFGYLLNKSGDKLHGLSK